MLFGGVFVSMTHGGPTGVLGFVPELPDKHVVPPRGEHARRFDFLYDRFRNKSLKLMNGMKSYSTDLAGK